MGDKGKPLRTGDKGMRTDERGPKPRRLTDRQTRNRGTRTNGSMHVCGPKPSRLTYRQTGTHILTYRHTREKGMRTNKLLRTRTRHKYVFAAQYIMVPS